VTSEQGLIRWLIHRAARGTPASLSERLEEEWLADMGSRTSPLSRLRFALGCCWATRVISLEHCAASVAIARPAAGGKLAVSYHDDGIDLFSRRSSTLVLVAALHIAVLYGLMAGLRPNSVAWIPPPLMPRWLPAEPHHEPPPPPPDKVIKPWRLDPPIPEVPPSDYASDDGKIISQPPENLPPVKPVHEVNLTQGGPGAGFPDAEDYYPPAAKRLEEQGISTVRVCVDAHGRLTSAPTTLQSSGSARLDEGALRLAQAGSGRYLASTEAGRAIDSCYAFRIRFKLKN
jgi:TonB family protein